MIEKFEVTLLCLVSLLASTGIFLRSNLFAYDSYAFLSWAKGFAVNPGAHQATYWILRTLPVNLLVYDVVMWLCLFISTVALYFGLKQVFQPRIAFISTLICLAGAPIMIFSFAQLQNELFAYPFIFLSFYCLMAKFKYHNWVALAFAGAACLFWSGAIVWVGIIACGLILPFVLAILVSLPWTIPLVQGYFGPFNSLGVAYQTYFWGLWDLFLFIPLVFVVFWERNKRYQAWMIVALLSIIVSARFTVLIIPFIGLGAGMALELAKSRGVLLEN